MLRLAPGDPRRDSLQERERLLLERNWEAWIGPLRDLAGSGKGHEPWLFTGFHAESCRHFRRGFVEKLTLDAATFLSRWPELFHTAPLRHLRLTGAGLHAVSASRPVPVWLNSASSISSTTTPSRWMRTACRRWRHRRTWAGSGS